MNIDKSIADFDKALKLNNELPYAFLHRGYAKLSKEDFDGAIKDFTEGIKLNPYNPDGFARRAIALSEKEKFDDALEDLNRAIDMDKSNTLYYFQRAIIKYHANDLDGTMQDYNPHCKSYAFSAPHDGTENVNDGEQLWRKLVSRYKNVGMVFSGHVKWAGARQVHTIATSAKAARSFWDATYQLPALCIFGNEHKGLDAETMAAAEQSVTIPMGGSASSLNVSIAVSLLVYEMQRITHAGPLERS